MTKEQAKKVNKVTALHPRNPHQGRYDLDLLCNTYPDLRQFLKLNPRGDQTVDFSDDRAVFGLNKALLAHYYHVTNWEIPAGYLCPPIPGRADYIHNLADVLAKSTQGRIPTGKQIRVLDVGTGASCIYPILGSQSYGWQFVASEIDPVSIQVAKLIVQSNKHLRSVVQLVQQNDCNKIFTGIIKEHDDFDLTLCNPPFHSSMAEAQAGNQRKLSNLNKGNPSAQTAKRNFGGQNAELWCTGGEIRFVGDMAKESVQFGTQVCWFSSLVSKSENVNPLKALLTRLGAKQIEVLKMSQGQKISRLIVWSFLSSDQQKKWAEERWKFD